LLAPSYLVPGVASFVVVPVLFATLGAAEYGRWALIYAVAAGVPQVTTSWVESRVVRFGHREGRSGDPRRAAAAVAGSMVLAAPLSLLVLPRATLAEAIAAALLTAMVSLYLIEIARLQARMAFGSVSMAAGARAVAGAVLNVAGAALTGMAWVAILGLAGGYVVGQLVGEAWMRRSSSAMSPNTGRVAAPAAPPPETPAYGVASAFNATSQYVLSVGDRFILSAFGSAVEVGVYTATYALVDLVARFVPGVLMTVVRARVFRAWDVGDREAPPVLVGQLATLLAGLAALAATGLVILGVFVPALPLDASLVGPIGIGLACYVGASSLAVLYSAAMRQGRLALHGLTAAASAILLNVALVPSMGPAGAAIATAGSYGVLLGLNGAGLEAIRRYRGPGLVVLGVAVVSLIVLAVGVVIRGPLLGAGAALLVLAAGTPAAISTGRAVVRRRSGGGAVATPGPSAEGEQDPERQP
jgi:O-antigen/teichoic acid export membrane protein